MCFLSADLMYGSVKGWEGLLERNINPFGKRIYKVVFRRKNRQKNIYNINRYHKKNKNLKTLLIFSILKYIMKTL